jgi:hypothetical protein
VFRAEFILFFSISELNSPFPFPPYPSSPRARRALVSLGRAAEETAKIATSAAMVVAEKRIVDWGLVVEEKRRGRAGIAEELSKGRCGFIPESGAFEAR